MLKVLSTKNLSQVQAYLDERVTDTNVAVENAVDEIISNVILNKDKALYDYTEKFDGVKLEQLCMEEDEIEAIYQTVDQSLIDDLKAAKKNIEDFHQLQLPKDVYLEKEDNIYLGERYIPLNRVGVYVPGGTAAYPSSVLMNVVPAKIAGVNEIVMVTPPSKDGSVNPNIVAAAKIAGVSKIYKVGGAQAVAALSYGTESIEKVDKIVGPGNIYVATAKKKVYGKVDIDMIAGPSEILVIADENANARYVAADLISQAEHDKLASAILLSTSASLVEAVNVELKKQTDSLERKDIIESSLENYGCAIVCDSIEQCISISNTIAPEHLELQLANAKDYLDQVKNAGSVFLGYYTCESIGDYFGGTNHVLPTSGTARFYSPLSTRSFMKTTQYLYYSKEAVNKYGPSIVNVANHEQLTGHANAVKVRLEKE